MSLLKFEKRYYVKIDGRRYRIVQIGRQWWMAENLDFKWEGLSIGKSGLSESEPRANYYDNDDITYGINGNKYGLMYNWIAVDYIEQNKATICPGWRVPSSDDFDTLANSVGGSSIAGTKLKSTTGWYESGNGDGSYGFNAFPAGTYWEEFGLVNMMTFFWTNTPTDSNNAINKYFKYNLSSMTSYSIRKYNQTSVRLCKDATLSIGGREYPTTRIGNQVWLAENLDLKWDGLTMESPVEITEAAGWYFDNDESTYGVNGNKYGILYNWYALSGIESRIPSGWRIPTKKDWDALILHINSSNTALKSTTKWLDGPTGTDRYGFTAYPSGVHYNTTGYDDTFGYKGYTAIYWSKTQDPSNVDFAYAEINDAEPAPETDVRDKRRGFAVRLVRDA